MEDFFLKSYSGPVNRETAPLSATQRNSNEKQDLLN
jgi:hypothetical protein